MVRHYYLSDNLIELKQVEQELLENGFTVPQLHVLSDNDAEIQKLHLNEVESVLKKDVVHSTEVGALVGAIGAVLVLTAASLLGWTESQAGWMPFIFLAIVVLGFCTWEGGFIGIQRPNVEFERFQKTLNEGKHIFFVDVKEKQQSTLAKLMSYHPNLILEGFGQGSPAWVVNGQSNYQKFIKKMP